MHEISSRYFDEGFLFSFNAGRVRVRFLPSSVYLLLLLFFFFVTVPKRKALPVKEAPGLYTGGQSQQYCVTEL